MAGRIESGRQAPRIEIDAARRPKAVSGLPWPFARRGSCLGLKFAALDFLSAKHSLLFVSRCSEVLQHTAAFWRDGPQPRHSPGHLPGLSICEVRRAERLFGGALRPPFDHLPGRHYNLNCDAWLTGKAGVELLRPAPNDFLRMWPVSKRVNASGRGDDDPSLIEPVEDEAIATS